MTQPKNRIVGLVGRSGAGKDALAGALMTRHGFSRLAFADPLRAAVSAITGWPVSALEDRDFKERLDPAWGVTPRRFLQHLGTEGVRSLKDDVWLTAFKLRLTHVHRLSPIVVTDVRFPNEVACLEELGALLVLVSRSSVNNTPVLHGSERMAWEWAVGGTPALRWPVLTIHNEGTLEELKAQARVVLACEHIMHDVPLDTINAEIKGR